MFSPMYKCIYVACCCLIVCMYSSPDCDEVYDAVVEDYEAADDVSGVYLTCDVT